MELAARIGTMARRGEIVSNWLDGYAFGADGKPYEKPGWSIMIEPVYVANWSGNNYYKFGVGVTDLDCFAVNYASDKTGVYDVFPCDLNHTIISFYTTLRKWMRLCAPTANIKQVYLYHRDSTTLQYTDILIEGGEIVNAAP